MNSNGSYEIAYDNYINWQAIDKAQREFKENFRKERPTEMYKSSMAEMWQAWILENGGLKHEALSIEVVDEQKYLLFLLRFG